MAEPTRPPGADVQTADGRGPVELPLASSFNLRGRGEAFHEKVALALGVALPTEANCFLEAGGRTAIWLGPDEWLVLGLQQDGDALEEALRAALDGIAGAVTDVTGNRVTLRLAGADARDLLAAGCPIDLHPRAFSPGRCAQTLVARTGVILLQRDAAPTYDLLVRRSFARYLGDWMSSVLAAAGRR